MKQNVCRMFAWHHSTRMFILNVLLKYRDLTIATCHILVSHCNAVYILTAHNNVSKLYETSALCFVPFLRQRLTVVTVCAVVRLSV